jgi:lactate dehydrogenase-like 2-hydroxyacid dehydrogenase
MVIHVTSDECHMAHILRIWKMIDEYDNWAKKKKKKMKSTTSNLDKPCPSQRISILGFSDLFSN